jgi:hypothetical protein
MNSNNNQIYIEDKGQFKGAWITSGSGIVITRDPNVTPSNFASMVGVENAIQIKSTSPRLSRDGKLGARFNFTLAPGFSIKFANEHQVKLITELAADNCNRLAMQLRQGWSFAIEAGDVDHSELAKRLAFTPLIVVLSHSHAEKNRHIEAWHSHPSYRIYAESEWVIKRNNKSAIAAVAA